MMERAFDLSDKVGDIVAEMPKASEVFRKHHIDFCCGGNRALAAAIEDHGANAAQVLEDLDAAYRETQELRGSRRDFRQMTLTALMDYIVSTHHAYLQRALPELSRLVTTILRVHGANHKELSRVHKLFHTLKADLEQHLITEEETVFPLIGEYEETGSVEALQKASEAISRLQIEHEAAGGILKELRSITEGYAIPGDACGTYEQTYKLLGELESDLFEHIHLENNILHPRLRLGR